MASDPRGQPRGNALASGSVATDVMASSDMALGNMALDDTALGNMAKGDTAIEYPPRWPWTISLLAGATLGGGPGIADLVEHLRSPQSTGLSPWVALSLGLAALEIAYLFFLLQIRQRVAFRCVAAALLAMAMGSASLLGVSLLASSDNVLLSYLGLNVSLPNTRIACLLMTAVHTVGALAVERYAPRPSRFD
jgi:hypothetical protein